MNISSNSRLAAEEIARAQPLAAKFSTTWIHYCKYCHYVGQASAQNWEHKANGLKDARLIKVGEVWYRVAQVTRQLKKLMK